MAFYPKNNAICPICKSGPYLFRRSASSHLIFLACNECGTVYLDPANVRLGTGVYPIHSTNWQIPGTSEFAFGGDSDWATMQEVENNGWADFTTGIDVPEANL